MAGARLRPRPARPARPSYLQLPVQTIPEPAGRDDDQADRCRQAAVHVLGHSPTPQPRLPSPAYRPGRRPGPAWRPGGVGDRRGVAGANLHGPGADAVGHEPQQVWVDHPVTGGDQDHDGNLRHASGPAGSAKAARDRLLHRGHDPRLLQGNVLDEVGRKRRRVEPHKPSESTWKCAAPGGGANRALSSPRVSPSSGANAEANTRPTTLATPVAASEMTAPP